jgi:hypothetical protein
MRCKGIAHIALATWLAAQGALAQQVAHDPPKKGAPTKSNAAPAGEVQVASDPAKKNAPSPKGAPPPKVVTKQGGSTVQAGGVPTAAESKQAPRAQKPSADRVSLDAPRASSSNKSAAAQHSVKPATPRPAKKKK